MQAVDAPGMVKIRKSVPATWGNTTSGAVSVPLGRGGFLTASRLIFRTLRGDAAGEAAQFQP